MGNVYQSNKYDRKTRFIETKNDSTNEIIKLNELLRNPTKFNTENEKKTISYFKKLTHKEAAIQALDFMKPKKITFSKIPINSYLKQKLQNKSHFFKRKTLTGEDYIRNNLLFLNYIISKLLVYEDKGNITMSSVLFSAPNYFLNISKSLNEMFTDNIVKNMAFFIEEKLKIEHYDINIENRNLLFDTLNLLNQKNKKVLKLDLDEINNEKIENKELKNANQNNLNLDVINANDDEKIENNKDYFLRQKTLLHTDNIIDNNINSNDNKSNNNLSENKNKTTYSKRQILNLKSRKDLFDKKSFSNNDLQTKSGFKIINNKIKNKNVKDSKKDDKRIKVKGSKNYKILRGKNYYDFLQTPQNQKIKNSNFKIENFKNFKSKINKIHDQNLFKFDKKSNENIINDDHNREKNKLNLKEVIGNINLKEIKRIPKKKIENDFNYEVNVPSCEYIKQLIYVKNDIWNKSEINFETLDNINRKLVKRNESKNSSFTIDKKNSKSESGKLILGGDFKNKMEILEKLKNENIFLFK